MQASGEKNCAPARPGLGARIRGALAYIVGTHRGRGPIRTVAALESFVSTRAAFISQHALFGYLKARIGTRYPSMLEDDTFVASVNIAKMHVYAACLSDLSIHAAARALGGASSVAEARLDVARRCFARGLDDNRRWTVDGFVPEDAAGDFAVRAAGTDWAEDAQGHRIFTLSQRELVRWAPIHEELKRYDAEYVRNSIRFAWGKVRRELRERLDAEAVAADARPGTPRPGP